MALYHLSVKPVPRSVGRSAVACAAYRSGEELHDERQGVTHDYTRKQGVEETLLLALAEAAWARQDREALWNAAEAAEKRKDARGAGVRAGIAVRAGRGRAVCAGRGVRG